jgi:hypothetical protein
MQELKVHIENADNELIIREGKATDPLPVKEPRIIAISGDIHSVSNFLKIRDAEPENYEPGYGSQEVDYNKALVTVDKFAGTLLLQLDPENHYGASILGTLEQSKEIEPFYINQEKRFDRRQLLKLIKFSRLYFDDKDLHASLMLSLSKLRMKTEQELKQQDDQRGNRSSSFERNVIDDNGFAQFFTLLIPIFKGFDPVFIRVEICLEPSETGIMFWLESPELVEVTQSMLDSIFNKELESCSDFVVIYK